MWDDGDAIDSHWKAVNIRKYPDMDIEGDDDSDAGDYLGRQDAESSNLVGNDLANVFKSS